MSPSLPPLPTDETHAERRRATILFADIQDSTELIRDLDPEAATRLLDPPIKLMLDAVARYHGTVSHVLGDGIVAIFGAPAASEDHAVMACLAAHAMLESLDARHAGAIRARIGLHSGDVVVRHVQIGKSNTYDSVGAAVHIAARLEQTAEPGTACISATTYELAKGFINARRLSPVAMKGIDGEVERYLLLGMNKAASRWSVRSARGLSAFTDRVREVKWLATALQRSGTGGGLAVHIAGPPGIGKSRLLHEFLSGGAEQYCVFRLAGSPHTKDAAFQPIRSWMLDWIGIRPSDPAAAAQAKLDAALRSFEGFTDIDHVRLSSLLGLRDRPPSGVGHPVLPVALRTEQTLAKAFNGIAAGRLIVLACDDVDCFDPMSLELLEALIVEMDTTPFLLITTSRSRFRLSPGITVPTQSLNLRPLSDADARKFLAQHDPRFLEGRELTQAVIQKTSGNPLFLEEVASLVVQDQAGDAGLGRNNGGIDRLTLAIPDRIEPLIADRLAKLSNKQRRLLELCAVIGNDVPLYLLASLAGYDEAELENRLERLHARRLIYRNEGDAGSYSFRHSIIRDVCFNGMLLATRRSYHARILEVLERDIGPRHDLRADDLCYHAINAELWDKAVVHLRAAADAAVERSAFKTGEFYLMRASEIAAKLPETDATLRVRIDILLSLRNLIGATAKYAETKRLLDQAEEIARKLGDPDCHARVLASRIHVLSILGDLKAAVSAGNRARTLARKAGDRSLLALSNFFLGQTRFNRGEFSKAETAFLENAAILRGPPIALRLGAMATLTVSNPANLAAVQAFQSRFEAAERSAHQALQAANATARPYDMTLADLYHGVVLLQGRSAEAATEAFTRALELARLRELEQLLPPVLVGLGQAQLLSGDLDRGLDRLKEAHELSVAQNRYMLQIWAASSLALVMTQLGRARDAVPLAHGAVVAAKRYGFAGFQIQALRSLGLAQTAVGDKGAAATLERALGLSRNVGARAESAHCHVALSACRHDKAGAHVDAARRIYAEIGMEKFLDRLMALPSNDRICLL